MAKTVNLVLSEDEAYEVTACRVSWMLSDRMKHPAS
jgi:hypothetical protein